MVIVDSPFLSQYSVRLKIHECQIEAPLNDLTYEVENIQLRVNLYNLVVLNEHDQAQTG
jgi:hypothetical protein